jgi:predicted methyltransferase MtxX (methanogen marker protein 4)
MKPQTIQEEALDKMINLLEGPANKLAEKILSSNIVLAPLSISLNLTFRAMAFVAGRKERK